MSNSTPSESAAPTPTITPGATVTAQPAGQAAVWGMAVLVAVLDVVICVIAFYLAYVTVFFVALPDKTFLESVYYAVTEYWKLGVFKTDDPSLGFGPYFSIIFAVPIIRLLTAWKLGLYNVRGEMDLAEDTVDLFRTVTIGTILLIVFIFGYRDAASVQGSYHQDVFVYDWLYCFAAMLAVRYGVRRWQVSRRRAGYDLRPVLVIGDNPVASNLREQVMKHPEIGYRFVEQLPLTDRASEDEVEQYLQGLPALIKRHGVQDVFIATTRLSQYQILSLLMALGTRSPVKVKLLPDLLGCYPSKVNITQLGNVPMLELFNEPIRGANRALKRGLDIVVSVIALTLLSPVLLACALAIKCTSKGPVLFKQTRIGLDCRPFSFYKLRTMYVDADQRRHEKFMEKVIQGQGVAGENGEVLYKEQDDPRITSVGRFLRAYSIDEIPQFYNVLRGDMSVVGPRPPIPYEVEKYENWQKGRLSAKPGITGVWQVSGRNAISFEEMVKMDIAYMENWSLWGDIKIILRTIPVVLWSRHAY